MKTGSVDLSWRIGGPQGRGVDTAAVMFARACAAGGLEVYGRREYYSNIMGRHSYYDVRVSDRPLT
ncbi:MAG TPA: 2-oxoacid:acceptor oxidoreductase family protein, partial [Bacillota bacterium]